MNIRALAGLRPPALRTLLRSGDAANRRRAWSDAETAYREALAVDRNLAPIWVQYGHALKEQGKLAEAEQAYRQSLALEPRVADTHLQLGHILKLQKRVDAAVDAYLTAYRLDGGLPFPAVELRALGVELRDTAPPPGHAAPAAALLPAFSSATRHSGADAARCPDCLKIAAEYGFSPRVLELFDSRYYFYTNPLVEQTLKTPDFHRCLTHFCETGIAIGLSFDPDLTFDAAFYCETYIGYQVAPENAYWHWLSVGIAVSADPNPERWLRNLFNGQRVSLSGVDFNLYRNFFYPNEQTAKWTELFTRFIDTDILRPGPHLPVTMETADFFLAATERFIANDNDEAAAKLYGRILLDVPTHFRTLGRYSEFLVNRGLFFEALSLYRQSFRGHSGSAKWLLRLAVCYEELGDLKNALLTLKDGLVRFAENPKFLHRFRAVSDKFLQQRWTEGIALGLQGDDAGAQQLLQDACSFLVSLLPEHDCLPTREIQSIAIVGVHSVPQCYFYRIEQKAEQLKAAGYRVTVFDVDHGLLDFLAQIYRFDAVIFYRVPAWGKVIEAIVRSRELGCVTFYDMDDLIFTDKDFPDRLESFGGLITHADHVGLKLGVPLYRTAMSLCDYGIASTPLLASQMEAIVRTGKVYVHRNGFGKKHERYAADAPIRLSDERVVIFYGSGTKSHKEDFQELVQPALIEIVKRYGERITIILAGHNVLTDALRAIENNICLIDPLWNYDEYWAVLRNVDINIAALKPNLMTDCKSEIKWLEASLFGIPSIVSGSAVYRDIIDHGSTGLICDSVEEWIDAFDLLIREPEHRREIGNAAKQRVAADYGLARMSYNLRRIIDNVACPFDRVKPTILVVNVFYPPHRIGGVTRLVEDNIRRFQEAHGSEFDIEVFTTHEDEERESRLKTYLYRGVKIFSVRRQNTSKTEANTEDAGIFHIFRHLLELKPPALVHFHCIQGLGAAVVNATRERGIPYFITAHDGWWISDHQFVVNDVGKPELYDYADPISILRSQGASSYSRMMTLRGPLFDASGVFAVSSKFAELYKSCGVPKVVVVENGISDLPIVARSPSPDGRVRLGFVGGLVDAKGYDLVRYALLARKYRNLRLLVVETGRIPGDVGHQTWNTTPVEFVPKTPEADVGRLYANIDVLLAPSVCIESFGLATREALHFGCWVIASDRGSIADCVSPGVNGYIIDVSEPKDLIQLLHMIDGEPERYLRSPDLTPVLRKSWEQADELAVHYKALIDGP